MTLGFYVAGAAFCVLVLAIVIEIVRLRSRTDGPQARISRHARRLPLVEDRMREAFEAPHAQYGEIFVSYQIWRKEHETRLELYTGDPWLRLNEFTRSIVVRHLWRALEKLSKGGVVVVDTPPQRWSKEVDAAFDDQGVDPWADRAVGSGSGSQFVKDN